jgi:hypothetical protein
MCGWSPIVIRNRIATLVALFSIVARSESFADSITIGARQDNTLYEDATGSVSNGAGSAMFAGRNSGSANSIRRALLAFDVAGAIPAGSTIASATLTLFNDAANISQQIVSLHRVTRAWGEGGSLASGGQGSGAPAAPGDATWLHRYFDTDSWSIHGGDFTPAETSSTVVAGPGFYTWPSTSALVDALQSFLDDPSSNYGWLLLGNESKPSTSKRFATREAIDPAVRPGLTVEYTPVPEPFSVLLLLTITILPAPARRLALLRRNLPCHESSPDRSGSQSRSSCSRRLSPWRPPAAPVRTP